MPGILPGNGRDHIDDRHSWWCPLCLPDAPTSQPGNAASCCCTSVMPPRNTNAAVKNTMHMWQNRQSGFLSAEVHIAAMSRMRYSLNIVRLLSSLRHACMAISHARFVRDLSQGEGGSRARNSAKRPVSSVSKYARKELVSRMSFRAPYSRVRQMASTPAARCITRRSHSVAVEGAIGSSQTHVLRPRDDFARKLYRVARSDHLHAP